jgi:hypothetical protein
MSSFSWLLVHLPSTFFLDVLFFFFFLTLDNFQLDAQNSYFFTYNTFITILYMLRSLPCSSSGGSGSTVHIYTQTIHRTTQLIWEECGPCPVFASYTLAFVLQLRKKHGKTSIRVAEEWQLARWKQNIQNRTNITIRMYKHNSNST